MAASEFAFRDLHESHERVKNSLLSEPFTNYMHEVFPTGVFFEKIPI